MFESVSMNAKEYNRKYYLENKEYFKKYYLEHKESSKKHFQKYYSENKESYLKSNRENWIRNRLKVIEIFGGKCCKCGFDDWRALQFDHISGDGNKERKENTNLYRFIMQQIKSPDFSRYQLLCANCNWIKKYENNENHGHTER